MAGVKIKDKTRQMIAEYCDLIDQGYTTAQIAKKFGLCIQTVHNNLGKIAEESGRTVEELRPQRSTKKPKREPTGKSKTSEETQQNETPKRRIDKSESVAEKLKKDFEVIEARLDTICAEIQKISDAEKMMPATLEGGEENG